MKKFVISKNLLYQKILEEHYYFDAYHMTKNITLKVD